MAGAQDAKTCKELLQMMPAAFDAEKAGDMDAAIQFDVGEPENFTGHLKIQGGAASYEEGPAESPAVTINTPPDVWLAIAKGEENGQMAFMTGKFKAQGDLTVLMRLGELFKA